MISLHGKITESLFKLREWNIYIWVVIQSRIPKIGNLYTIREIYPQFPDNPIVDLYSSFDIFEIYQYLEEMIIVEGVLHADGS